MCRGIFASMMFYIHIIIFAVIIYFTAGVYHWSWMINDMRARQLSIWKMIFILVFIAFPYAMVGLKNYKLELKRRGFK